MNPHLVTSRQKPGQAERNWIIFDAAGQILGRLAVQIADVLRGKHRPTFQNDIEMGDHVVVINADKIKVTGRKLEDKIYYHHSLHIGGLKQIPLGKQLSKFPDRPISIAVRGMLPKNKMRDSLMTRLHIYAGPSHPHSAQKPTSLGA